MASEFGTIVSCYGFDNAPKRPEKMYYHFSQCLCVLTLVELSHEEHICTSLNDSDDGAMVFLADDSVHLEVPEAFAISLFWTLINTYTIRYRGQPSSDWSCPVFELVTAVLVVPSTTCLSTIRSSSRQTTSWQNGLWLRA